MLHDALVTNDRVPSTPMGLGTSAKSNPDICTMTGTAGVGSSPMMLFGRVTAYEPALPAPRFPDINVKTKSDPDRRTPEWIYPDARSLILTLPVFTPARVSWMLALIDVLDGILLAHGSGNLEDTTGGDGLLNWILEICLLPV